MARSSSCRGQARAGAAARVGSPVQKCPKNPPTCARFGQLKPWQRAGMSRSGWYAAGKPESKPQKKATQNGAAAEAGMSTRSLQRLERVVNLARLLDRPDIVEMLARGLISKASAETALASESTMRALRARGDDLAAEDLEACRYLQKLVRRRERQAKHPIAVVLQTDAIDTAMSIARSVVARCVAQLPEAKAREVNRARRHAKAMVRMLSEVIEEGPQRRQSLRANGLESRANGRTAIRPNTQETCVNECITY
jgi:hypothetical protein